MLRASERACDKQRKASAGAPVEMMPCRWQRWRCRGESDVRASVRRTVNGLVFGIVWRRTYTCVHGAYMEM